MVGCVGGGVGMDQLDRDVRESASLLLPIWRMLPPPKGTASIQESCVDEPVKFLSGTQDSGEEAHGWKESSCQADNGRDEFRVQERAGG